MTYRVGNHQPQNVYRGDQYIGVMFTAEDAALVVEALNEHERLAELRRDVTEHLMPEPTPRIRACVEGWPECVDGDYDPRCCRFPKSCSCTSYDPEQVTEEYLEDQP